MHQCVNQARHPAELQGSWPRSRRLRIRRLGVRVSSGAHCVETVNGKRAGYRPFSRLRNLLIGVLMLIRGVRGRRGRYFRVIPRKRDVRGVVASGESEGLCALHASEPDGGHLQPAGAENAFLDRHATPPYEPNGCRGGACQNTFTEDSTLGDQCPLLMCRRGAPSGRACGGSPAMGSPPARVPVPSTLGRAGGSGSGWSRRAGVHRSGSR